jgi:Fe-S-cluster containining protein
VTVPATSEEYVRWAEARADVPPHPVLEPVDDERRLRRVWRDGAFRCESHRCTKVCCTGWPTGEGIRLNLLDLVRLKAAGLLSSVRGAFRVAPRDQPRMRSVDGHCVHYDPAARRCTIWEHRPTICRTYPFAIAYTDAGGIELGFSGGCSLTPTGRAMLCEDPEQPTRVLRVRPAEPEERAGDLAPYERGHLEACVAAATEHERTCRLVTQRPDAVRELGLANYLPTDD